MDRDISLTRSTIIKFVILFLLVLSLYYSEIISMVADWSAKKEYSHGFLIPLISVYIIWRKRMQLKNAHINPEAKGMLILLSGLMLLVLGDIGFEPFTRRFSMIVTFIGIIFFLLGRDVVRIILFPVGYLIFMIPLPYILIKTIAVNLRLVGARLTYLSLDSMGVPIVNDGVRLELPNISLTVGDLCTGVLSIIAILALSVLYAYITQKHILSKMILVMLAVPMAIFSNIIRLIMTVGLVYVYGEKVLGNVIHQFHGTVNFTITVILLVIAGNFIKKIDSSLLKKR
jgi:exosortase